MAVTVRRAAGDPGCAASRPASTARAAGKIRWPAVTASLTSVVSVAVLKLPPTQPYPVAMMTIAAMPSGGTARLGPVCSSVVPSGLLSCAIQSRWLMAAGLMVADQYQPGDHDNNHRSCGQGPDVHRGIGQADQVPPG